MERKEILELEKQSLLMYPEGVDYMSIIQKLKEKTTILLQKALIELKEDASSKNIFKKIPKGVSLDSCFTNIETNVLQAASNVIDNIQDNIKHLLHVPEHLSLADLFLEEKPDQYVNDSKALLCELKREHEEQLVVLAMLRQELKDYECLDLLVETSNCLFEIERKMDTFKVPINAQIGLVELIQNGDYELINSIE